MKNTTLLLISLAVVLVACGVIYFNSQSPSSPSNPGAGTGSIQELTLGMKNYNYYPQTIRVTANQPVSITLDKSVAGCYRSFTIRDLGVNQYSKNPSETIDFTPTKTGTFRFACSMGMGTGTIIVE